MPALTPKHEIFAQHVANGLSHSEAWRKATGKKENADVNAASMLGRPGIKERISELKEANSAKATLSREQIIDWLCDVISTSAAKVEADSPLVQSVEFLDGKPVKLRIPDKIAAVTQLAKICGWLEPKRIELAAGRDTLAEFVDAIREAGGPRELAEAERRGLRRPYGGAEFSDDSGEL